MTMARITSKGQVTIPKEIRERFEIGPGDALDFTMQGDLLEVRPIRRRRVAEFRGLFPIREAMDISEERARSRAARAERLATGREVADG